MDEELREQEDRESATRRLVEDASRGDASQAAMGKERIEEIERAFDALRKDYRDAIVLSRVVGLSNVEIAERMGRSPGAVANLIYRGLARLSKLLKASM